MLTLIAAAAAAAAIDAAACTALQDVKIDNLTVVSAELMPEGPFTGGQQQAGGQALPAHCRLTLKLSPTEESDINAELWLPAEDWNGKYLAVGNGGWAGTIQGFGDMQAALRRGYATAGSDNGSSFNQPNGMFALGKPERLVDFAYRALHDMTTGSKTLISTAYSQAPQLSYYKGCSTGGRQGLMAAQRFPGDYDGIIAGAPANRHIHMHVAQSWEQIRVNNNPLAAISAGQATLINNLVADACKAAGDSFISDPGQCSVDLSVLQCSAGQAGDQCLSQAQMETVDIYYGGVTTNDGEIVFAGRPFSVPMTAIQAGNEAPTPFLFDSIRILGFADPDYDWRNFNISRDLPVIDSRAGFVDAIDPDLRDFRDRGGKLLMYHGWEDPGITPRNAIDYYITVMQETDSNPEDWLQLYMVPGMGHCAGGPGPDSFDTLSVLEDWRENNAVPSSIQGLNRSSGLSRPLCPFPEAARYSGSGDRNSADNWACAAP